MILRLFSLFYKRDFNSCFLSGRSEVTRVTIRLWTASALSVVIEPSVVERLLSAGTLRFRARSYRVDRSAGFPVFVESRQSSIVFCVGVGTGVQEEQNHFTRGQPRSPAV